MRWYKKLREKKKWGTNAEDAMKLIKVSHTTLSWAICFKQAPSLKLFLSIFKKETIYDTSINAFTFIDLFGINAIFQLISLQCKSMSAWACECKYFHGIS